MARSLVLGNGQILTCLDENGQLRDFYFHYVGLENQMYKGCIGRIGVWVDGQFSWFGSGDWQITVNFQDDCLVGNTKAVNLALNIEINITDAVYNEKNILLRNFVVKNLSDQGREVRVFLNNQFHLFANKTADTAYFDPIDNTMVHYKGRRVVIIGGKFVDYTVGVFGIEGKEGSFMDAEDGLLSKNPVEHGPTDSVVGFSGQVDAKKEFEFDYWYCIAKSFEEAKELNQLVVKRGAKQLIQTTQDYWKAWLATQKLDLNKLNKDVASLYKKSLLILRAHTDNGGGIIASGDSEMILFGKDTYGYIWPRDGAYAANALDLAGYSHVSRLFFDFCNNVISAEGYFYHKYQPDKSIGSSWHPRILYGKPSLAIQQDETALVLVALWNHYLIDGDLEFIENVYNSLIKKAASWLLEFRDSQTGLPLPSYDLWEMKHGTSTFTAASVVGALNAAKNFANLFGKKADAKIYAKAGDEIKEAILTHLWDSDLNYFYKHIEVRDGEVLHDKTVDASSFYGVFNFGILPIHDPKLELAYQTLKGVLEVRGEVGGFARFEGDLFFQENHIAPGNPWFITTLWMAQYEIAKAKSKKDLIETTKWLEWTVKYSLASGVLAEQVDPLTAKPLSAGPLVWSHAEYVTTVTKYLEKLKELEDSV